MVRDTTMATTTTTTASATALLAPGFRFHPTDEELVRYYLTRKVSGKSFRFDAIAEVDIYKSEPWDLPNQSRLTSRDMEWFFFGALDKKYGNGSRMNRATGKGYWKATGNDRAVHHDSRTIGMKKTLVFHKGRAPDGKRTNWVMHEYRLVDEELERAGIPQDGYVLCKVFEKSGLGPNGKLYAPFVEEEWDDDNQVLVPSTAAPVYGNGTRNEGDSPDQDTISETAARDGQDVAMVCKRERQDDCPLPSIYDPEPLQRQNKRKKVEAEDPNPSQHTNALPTQDPGSSTRTKTTALFGFPLFESIEQLAKEPQQLNQIVPPRRFDIATFDLSVHPSYLELIDKLQKEIHNISIERETLKMEVMSAQTMITILQSRLNYFTKENEDFQRMSND